ncbi:hypothetical protein RRG08_060235 [Elysia crispata]|uniref:Fibrinogen C-terminal domain-containing protein n=1 Tax=Elysia crispata TaxID=231223 RepID=A0AAE1DNN1_9GAST|nr:hypothetical protein RRG08_060235 [Elysia crispata]
MAFGWLTVGFVTLIIFNPVVGQNDTNDVLTDSSRSSEPTDCHKNMNSSKYLGEPLHTMWHSTLNRSILCDVRLDGGGWIVIQRRTSRDIDFRRNWTDYRDGFGSYWSSFWLGNEDIYQLTTRDFYELRIDLKVQTTNLGYVLVYAHYTTFRIGSESENYALNLGVYSGTAGEYPDCGMAYSNGQQFTTIDRDNDPLNLGNCAKFLSGGGWWYKRCTCVSLNDDFNLLFWMSHVYHDPVPVVRSKMMIRKLW